MTGREGIVRAGEKMLLAERKRYHEGRSRAFVGTVEGVDGDLVRLTGWQWTYRAVPPGYVRKDQAITVIMRLDNDLLAVILPPTCRVEELTLDLRGSYLTISDGSGFDYVDPLHAPGG